LIDPNFYAERSDLEAMLAALEVIVGVAQQKPLARYVRGTCLPDADKVNRTGLLDALHRHTQTMYHPTGTCAMGDAEGAVLDPELRMRGITGLRVVDASVMPATIRGNTNAPVVMIAEKAADLILT
jgi:choline dehydrogenase